MGNFTYVTRYRGLRLGRPLLRLLDPRARIPMRWRRYGSRPRRGCPSRMRDLRAPIRWVATGHDMNALCNALLRFGFIEVGAGDVSPAAGKPALDFSSTGRTRRSSTDSASIGRGSVQCALLGGHGGIVGLISKARKEPGGEWRPHRAKYRSRGKV